MNHALASVVYFLTYLGFTFVFSLFTFISTFVSLLLLPWLSLSLSSPNIMETRRYQSSSRVDVSSISPPSSLTI